MLQKIVFVLCVAGFIMLAIFGCRDDQTAIKIKTPLESALDSAELMFISPVGEKIVSRITPEVCSAKDVRVRIRGLRIISMVLLSNKDVTSLGQLDTAVSFVKKGEQLALAINDSIEWALCTVQLFRYKSLKHEWYFGGDEKIGSKEKLRKAIEVLERARMTDGLSMGYRTLSHAISIDDEGLAESLKYDLLALEYNDSIKYPNLRARSCADLANKYWYFGQTELAKNFYLRSIEIFKYYDTLHHSVSLLSLANLINDDVQTPHYYRMAADVARSCKATVWESEVYFELGQRFQGMGQFDSALFYLRKSVDTAPKNLGNYREVMEGRDAAMALSYLQLGQKTKALKLTAIREQRLEKIWYKEDKQMSELYDLSAIYRAVGDLRKLIAAQAKLATLTESLNSHEKMVSVGKVQGRLQLELKNKQLKILEMSAELHASAATHELWLRFLLIGIAFVTAAGFVIVRILLTRQKRLHRFLTMQNNTITRQKKDIENSLQKLQQTQAHILNSEKMAMLGQFTAGVAHELNNPLNFVSGGLSVLEETIEEAGEEFKRERQMLVDIRGGIDRAMTIVNSLRVFSNPRSGIGYDSYSDIAECMKASLLVMQSRITANEINVVSDLSEQMVVGHSGQLCQIFINIIDNAIHAVKDMPKERKRIHIRFRKHGPNVLIDFQDCGAGIPESVYANLFRPFFTTKPAGQGIGLGLFICNTILKTIDGAIAFESRADVGTTFSVQLARPK